MAMTNTHENGWIRLLLTSVPIMGVAFSPKAGTLKTCEENAVQARWQWDILSVKLTVILHQSPAGGQELMTGLSVQFSTAVGQRWRRLIPIPYRLSQEDQPATGLEYPGNDHVPGAGCQMCVRLSDYRNRHFRGFVS
ncbi:hypothetical protein Y1Q_0008098 [Alligator mississippiensis]|uniref:Uncharacterized protein n=1 Tax=Alligator mississippiensis TaxID=8496 RepID=A0A151NFJ7_ALLMI|nr:hypothetical protein Y1Q_0008098 [Alligator mississippiensis]